MYHGSSSFHLIIYYSGVDNGYSVIRICNAFFRYFSRNLLCHEYYNSRNHNGRKIKDRQASPASTALTLSSNSLILSLTELADPQSPAAGATNGGLVTPR